MRFINDRFFKLNNTCVTLGKFDGLHRGHMLLINKAVDYCKDNKMNSVVFTFDMPRKSIYGNAQKFEILEQCGVDICIMYPFDMNTSQMKAQEFVSNILAGALDVKRIIVGSDFCFGHNRMGNVELLEKLAPEYGYEIEVVDKLTIGNEIVSSTLIKKCLADADIQSVNELLGRKYSMEGIVVQGKQLGRMIGFPTANIIPDNNVIMPHYGVYETSVYIEGVSGNAKKGITNVGMRPTVEGAFANVETYIDDFCDNIYERKIKIEFEKFIRPEMKFSSVDELKKQIKKDLDSIR